MKTLYLDCGMGAAGDMLTAALLELLPEPEAFVERLNRLGLPGVKFCAEKSVRCGVTGTHMKVTVNGAEEGEPPHGHEHSHSHEQEDGAEYSHEHAHGAEHSHSHPHGAEDSHEQEDEAGHSHEYAYGAEHSHSHPLGAERSHEQEHEAGHSHGHTYGAEHSHEQEDGAEHSHEQGHAHSHAHSSLQEIADIVRRLAVPAEVQEDVLAVYGLIAEAESHVHGVPVTDIHFHEVGALDAVADITAVSLLFHELAPERVVASAVHVESGQVRCAHGILPVPAPATAYLLRGVPVYGGSVKGELCTPTGAALLRRFVSRFGEMPPMRLEAIGYGMGKKDFEAANCMRALLGETEDGAETVCELCCNLDDMTGEAVGYAEARFFEAGALDVYTVPIGMKKSRPGVQLCVLCREADKERMIGLFFRHTTTLGVRERTDRRHVLFRKTETVSTPCGDVRRKLASGYGVTRSKWEHDDLARIAGELGCSLAEARERIERYG